MVAPGACLGHACGGANTSKKSIFTRHAFIVHIMLSLMSAIDVYDVYDVEDGVRVCKSMVCVEGFG